MNRHEAADHFEIHERTLRKWRKAGRIGFEDGYYLVDDQGAPVGEEGDDMDDVGVVQEPREYLHDPEKKTYTFSTGRGVVVLSEKQWQWVCDNYSNYTTRATQNTLARKLGIQRTVVRDILKAAGRTKDNAPLTDEEIAAGEIPDLARSIVRKKEGAAIVRANARIHRNIERDADKWRNVEEGIGKLFEGFALRVPKRATAASRPARDGGLVFFHHTDAHIGKHGRTFEQERNDIVSTTARMVDSVLAYGRPEKFVTCFGGDWFHIDTAGKTTTRGTPQSVNGEWYEIVQNGIDVFLAMILALPDDIPVEVYVTPGNHDRIVSMTAGYLLAKLFEDDDMINVHPHVPQNRHYVEYGANMIMLTHGDGGKPKDYPAVMAAEERAMWGRTAHAYVYHGHLHHEKVTEYKGAVVTQMPSTADDDDYHRHECYIGNTRRLCAYVHDRKAGRVAQIDAKV